MLTNLDLKRYDRQMLILGWGEKGQVKLKNSKVVVAGVGGLGAAVALYLSAVGVGRIVLIDNERFELSNLNRQILGFTKDVGRLKTRTVKEKLQAFNPEIEVYSKVVKITRENIRELINGSNVVVDCMDNWETRYVINEGCSRERIPMVHSGVYSWSGQITTILPGRSPCLRCIVPRSPPEIKPVPVLGATSGLFAMLQVMEVIKLITGLGIPLAGKLLIFDGEYINYNLVEVSRNPNCPVCKDIK